MYVSGSFREVSGKFSGSFRTILGLFQGVCDTTLKSAFCGSRQIANEGYKADVPETTEFCYICTAFT